LKKNSAGQVSNVNGLNGFFGLSAAQTASILAAGKKAKFGVDFFIPIPKTHSCGNLSILEPAGMSLLPRDRDPA
jgi:hypothetical protein